MKRLIGILLLLTVNTAMAQFGQAIKNYQQNQANQNNQNGQNGQTSTSNNTVIYGAPSEQQLAAPRARAAAHKGYGARNNRSNRTSNRNRGNGARNR